MRECQHMYKTGNCAHWVCYDCGTHGGTDFTGAHVIATCATCGFRFDMLLGTGCPKCRTEAVKKAFAPIDSLRTALGVLQFEDQKGIRLHGKLAEKEFYRRVQNDPEAEEQTETPEGCKMPIDEAAQIYELRRMFRL